MGEVILVFIVIISFIAIMTVRLINQDKDRNEQAKVTEDAFTRWKKNNSLENITPKKFSIPGFSTFLYIDSKRDKLFFWQNKWHTTKLQDRFTELESSNLCIEFSSIIKSEILINNDDSSKLGDAIVGGALFGAIGAGAALMSKADISSIVVNVYTNSLSKPLIQIPIIDYSLKIGLNVKNDTDKKEKINEAISFANTINATILSITNQTVQNSRQNNSVIAPINDSNNIATHKNNTAETKIALDKQVEDIKKLKELLDIGAITQEEFDIKKKDILGL